MNKLIAGPAANCAHCSTRTQRDAAVVTAVQVARDWAIEQHGDRTNTPTVVRGYMYTWLKRNGAQIDTPTTYSDVIGDLVDAIWELAELDADLVDPLTLVDDDFHGTSSDARNHLRNRYERDLQHALNRITWKA